MEVHMRYMQYCLLALAAVAPALAQTSVEQILEKYTQALGGQAAYEKVTTRAMKGTVEIPDDNVTGAAQIVAKAPGSFRLTMDIPGYGVVETVLDGGNGWEKNPDSGTHAMSKTDLAVAQRDHHFYREVRLKELYPKMETAGADKVEGHAVYVIEATPAGGSAEKFYFDAESGLLVKHDFERVTLEDGIVQYEMLLRDYREVDGLKLPFTIEQRSPDNTTIFKFAEIKNNVTLADTAFAKPEK
jgi:outer membrane lipoprotein-sorting protein